jgi:uncharacterized protein YndB with AHSA1/START domain
MSTSETATTEQVYRVYIKASPQAVWEAITTPEWTERYGYRVRENYDLRPGGAYRGYTSEEMRRQGALMGNTVPELAVDGEVIEADPPRRLVLTWRMLMDDNLAREGFSRLTYDLREMPGGGATKLTVVHDLAQTPGLLPVVDGTFEEKGAGGGWNWILSDLKSLLETGAGLNG